MASKLDRWKKISSSSKETIKNPNKSQIVDDLARIPTTLIEEQQEQGQDENQQSKSENNNQDDSSRIESVSTTKDDDVGVKHRSNTPTPRKKRERDKLQKKDEPPISFTSKVNEAVRSYIDNKQTKDDTHKKTSFLLRLDLLAKLDNFNNAHGGRIKGEFVNNLLENAFAELEEDPQWKEILNQNLDQNIERIKRRR